MRLTCGQRYLCLRSPSLWCLASAGSPSAPATSPSQAPVHLVSWQSWWSYTSEAESKDCLYHVCFFSIRNFIKKHSEPLTFFPKHAPNRDIYTSHLQGTVVSFITTLTRVKNRCIFSFETTSFLEVVLLEYVSDIVHIPAAMCNQQW